MRVETAATTRASPVEWAVDHWDTVLTLAASTVFAVLAATGAASGEVIRGATLAVLALLAGNLIRLRSAREDTQSHVDRITESMSELRPVVEGLRSDVSAMQSGAPWRVLQSRLEWDLTARDLAHFKKTRKVHFYRNDVMSLHDWFEGDGRSQNETALPGRFIRDPKQTVGDREYSLIFLPQAFKKGDEPEIVITRELVEAFPGNSNEYALIDILEETDDATIEVIWPLDKPPTKVWVQGKAIPYTEIDVSELDRPDGRKAFKYRLWRPKVGENAYIYWNW